MYFDFETTLKPIDERPNSSTQLYARYEPNSFCLHVINDYEPATMPRVYCGERAVETFFEYLIDEAEKAMEYMGHYTPYDPDKAIEYNPKKCHICELPISPSEIPVVDHWHQAEGGTIRGYAHNSCNLKYQQPNYTTIYAHNAAKYDQKLILKHMNIVQGSITVIARSDEEFITISKNYSNGVTCVRLRFVDSYKMLSGSLENLVQNMGGERDLFIQTRKIIPDHLLHLAMRKSVFPYSYITSEAVFDETELPPIGAFFNDLSKEPCSPENYKHAQECWTAFGMKTLGDYNRFYVMLDTLLLSDVISAFRKTAQLSHGLDPAHFISNASYTWFCMLWHSRQKIELLTDIDQYYTFKNLSKIHTCGLRNVDDRYGQTLSGFVSQISINCLEKPQNSTSVSGSGGGGTSDVLPEPREIQGIYLEFYQELNDSNFTPAKEVKFPEDRRYKVDFEDEVRAIVVKLLFPMLRSSNRKIEETKVKLEPLKI
ncbi:unnamed protein product [Bemisia tabaci]|uniref:DNA-directed DNA polymerase n=1 Tax=Bemisia tabaci TaxID=7038 RepID=A0A9P0F6W1_BEMTA|nr:unnamed protein product [Bemisia tabaci]